MVFQPLWFSLLYICASWEYRRKGYYLVWTLNYVRIAEFFVIIILFVDQNTLIFNVFSFIVEIFIVPIYDFRHQNYTYLLTPQNFALIFCFFILHQQTMVVTTARNVVKGLKNVGIASRNRVVLRTPWPRSLSFLVKNRMRLGQGVCASWPRCSQDTVVSTSDEGFSISDDGVLCRENEYR